MNKMRDRRKYYEVLDIKEQQKTCDISEDKFYKTEKDKISYPCWLFLDQSTQAGYCLFDNDSRLILSGVADTNNKKLSVREFTKEFTGMIENLIEEFKIENVFYERVYDEANKRTTEVLYYVKHKITDLDMKHNITIHELDHRKWKGMLAGKGEKYDFNKNNKKETMRFVEQVYPLVSIVTDDESDAIGMGVSIMIRNKDKKNVWKLTSYDKKLPIITRIYELDIREDNIEQLVKDKKLTKPFREAYEHGGFYELELDRAKKIDVTARKYLSHRDVLLLIKIPKTYKYWGYMLLINGINPDNLETEDESFNYLVARRRRL